MNLVDRNQKQRDFFNEKIDTYDDVHAKYMETKKTLADNLPVDSKKILDLGAGTGLELIHVFERFPSIKVTAVDISEKMLEELKKRDFSSNVETICGDFFEVDFGINYDAMISTSALHHFKKEEKVELYKKIYNSLKDGGLFINSDKIALTDDIEETQVYELDHNIDNYKHIDTPLTVEHEVEILSKIGFKDINVQEVDKEDYRLIICTK